MKSRIAIAACVAALSAMFVPATAQADETLGCSVATEVRSEGIFHEGWKVAEIKLKRAMCPAGVKFFAKLIINREWTSQGYEWTIWAGLRIDNTPKGEAGFALGPDLDVMSKGYLTTCSSGIEALGKVDILHRGGTFKATVKNDTRPCNG